MSSTARNIVTNEEKEPFKSSDDHDSKTEQKSASIENRKEHKGKWGVIHPYSAFKIAWDLLVSLVIVASAIEIPLTMAFDIAIDFSTTIGKMSFCIDMFLLCDICVTFRTAFYDKYDRLRLIVNPNIIATNYLKGWFIFDFITSFPFDFILAPFSSEAQEGVSGFKVLRLVRLLRLLRVFRIYKMLGIMREMNRLFPTLKKWLGISQVMVAMLFVSHYFACIWFGVAKTNQYAGETSWLDFEDPPIDIDGTDYNVYEAYTTCLYWAVVTLFTTGYGDITAHNTNEKWVAMGVIVMGSIMTAYLVGTLTVLAFEGDKDQQYTEEKMDEAYSFGAYYNLSNELIRAITAHIEYHCAQNYISSDPNEFLKSLPQHLRSKVELEISSRAIQDIDFFRGLPVAILGHIGIRVQSIGCNAGHKLYVEGETSSEIYVLRTGCARVYFGKSNANRAEGSRLLTRGDVCGESCIISTTRSNTLVCETWCEFSILRKESIKEIICDHLTDDVADEVWQNMKQILRENPHIQRRMDHVKSAKFLKAKAKANIEDTIYDDLFSVPNTRRNGFVNVEGIPNEDDVKEEGEAVAGIVGKMRNMSRVDSAILDLEMKQHYKRMHEKGDQIYVKVDIKGIQLNDDREYIGDRGQTTMDAGIVQLISTDSTKLNVIVDDEEEQET